MEMQIKKRKDKWNDLFELAMYVTAAVCFVYFWVKGVPAKMFKGRIDCCSAADHPNRGQNYKDHAVCSFAVFRPIVHFCLYVFGK